MPLRFLTLITGILLAASPVLAAELKPFSATYAASYSGFGVTAKRQLSGTDDNWHLDFNAHSMFADIRESSRFVSEDSLLVPQHYEYHKTGLGRDRHTVLQFEPALRRVINVTDSSRTLENVPPRTQDKLSYQLQLALDVADGKKPLKYRVANGKRIDEYEFTVAGREILKTPLGSVEAIKVQRVRDGDSERLTNIWFAPQWNYALVKLMQREDDGKTYQISLTELSIDGKSISGDQ